MKNKKDSNQKTFLGMPMNWNHQNIFQTMWNKNDDKVFPPKAFGIGWTINFHAALKKTCLLAKNINSKNKKRNGDAND